MAAEGSDIRVLLSLPTESAADFNLTFASSERKIFAGSDPAGHRVGSGGGTVALIDQWLKANPSHRPNDKKIIIHSCGQSRRLPAYASVGKILTPMPVMRWSTGESIDQTLLTLQLPLYEHIMRVTPARVNTLVASGDVYLQASAEMGPLPDADVICFGLWSEPEQASRHGVFFSRKDTPQVLDFMLQKPDPATIGRLSQSHYWLMDIGLWLLSDRAVELLRKKTAGTERGVYGYYDLYSDFGCALGSEPSRADATLPDDLKVAILPLPEGRFLHFGSTPELLSSTAALQNSVTDQRLIHSYNSRPASTIFVQNCNVENHFTDENEWIWIDNSDIPSGWRFTRHNVVTGASHLEGDFVMPPGICIDESYNTRCGAFVLRPYGYFDAMKGATDGEDTMFLGIPFGRWIADRGLEFPAIADIYDAPLFPTVNNAAEAMDMLRWMVAEPEFVRGRDAWLKARKVSAAEICDYTDVHFLREQSLRRMSEALPVLERNYEKSVYYQLDLNNLHRIYRRLGLSAPAQLPDDAPALKRIRNAALLERLGIRPPEGCASYDDQAYAVMRENILRALPAHKPHPTCSVYSDQIVWARSPVRIDLAGGWTDTPPYSVLRGGSVVNVAVDLGGQPPLQAFVKPSKDYRIVLRSIDLGASETVTTYEDLRLSVGVGNAFAIPKTALALSGFLPEFTDVRYPSLEAQLKAFGSGLEITLLSAVPAGSGLGTSSILAATVLGALSNFCGLRWSATEICTRALALEQILGTCGGWQDQYGGILPGLKTLHTVPGWTQEPVCNWLPDDLFTESRYAPCHLLYYTGITRTAKNILGEIVQNIMLNDGPTLSLLDSMHHHTQNLERAIQTRDLEAFGRLTGHSWELNKALDRGTNPTGVQAIIDRVAPWLLGCKLPGAGGGGFLYMVARSADDAARIQERLSDDSVNPGARFVGLSVSADGLKVSRS